MERSFFDLLDDASTSAEAEEVVGGGADNVLVGVLGVVIVDVGDGVRGKEGDDAGVAEECFEGVDAE